MARPTDRRPACGVAGAHGTLSHGRRRHPRAAAPRLRMGGARMRLLMPNVIQTRVAPVQRVGLPSAVDDRLYFAQVREDPCLELEGLAVGPDDAVVVVGSGGCTALSLLAAGAGRVTAVDMNRTQNHLIELKLAAIAVLSRIETLSFLGATGGTPIERIDAYAALRPWLTPKACAYWDSHLLAVAGG